MNFLDVLSQLFWPRKFPRFWFPWAPDVENRNSEVGATEIRLADSVTDSPQVLQIFADLADLRISGSENDTIWWLKVRIFPKLTCVSFEFPSKFCTPWWVSKSVLPTISVGRSSRGAYRWAWESERPEAPGWMNDGPTSTLHRRAWNPRWRVGAPGNATLHTSISSWCLEPLSRG